MKINYEILISKMIDAALSAGNIIKNSTPEQRKNLFIAKDRVTVTDIEAEKLITTILRNDFPDIEIISEESSKNSNAQNSVSMDNFTGFLVDPIDGSVNFSRLVSPNYGNFAVSIGFAENGEVKAGVIYKPLENEIFHAIRQKGAFQDNIPIHVSNTDNINHASIEVGSYWIRENLELFKKWFTDKNIDVEQILIRGSAAAALADVARGRIDVLLFSRLHTWDYAAGWVIVEEAGGIVMDGDCSPLKLGSRYIYATNKNLNEFVKKILRGN